jgi:hypothetical protein
MLPIGRHHRVLRGEGRHHPYRHSLLTDVEVEEATDLRGSVEFRTLLLEATDEEHLPEEAETLVTVGCRMGLFFLHDSLLG